MAHCVISRSIMLFFQAFPSTDREKRTFLGVSRPDFSRALVVYTFHVRAIRICVRISIFIAVCFRVDVKRLPMFSSGLGAY